MINRTFFFSRVRSQLFTGKLSPGQVSGLTVILDAWDAQAASKDDRWLAYMLGTTFHETAFTMQPIHERGGASYFFNRYDKDGQHPDIAKRLGNSKSGDGVLFHGRGFVQLTGRTNYTKMSAAFSRNLTRDAAAADGALEPPLAAKIMFKGMEEGVFTSKKLSDYFNGTKEDWTSARRIINGLDSAAKIALYAQDFYGAISHTT